MPQLNPAPWLAILLFAWGVFLVIIPAKITSHLYPNTPTPLDASKKKTQPWTWPWY
uniref:ATP synthase complex subunit 8 n=1 Tax=Pontinus nematophthalmus TaxID=2996719 RepID=A0AA51ZUB4_9TELE|nr:ATP synthase F0 subunit 8 [Pontinus nematophthalmus]WMY89646.1 ATP synthase F0 subunit 8 [Pontinus nematophthalmus]